MIGFHDIGESHLSDLHMPPKIHETHSPRVESAKSFWNDLFSEMGSAQETQLIDENEIASEVYDRYEDEFDFDFEIDGKLQKALDVFNASNWEKLTGQEKQDAVCDFVEVLSERLGLDKTPPVEFYEGEVGDFVGYYGRDNSIKINTLYLDDPKETVDTLAHELRHAYQHQRAQIGETKTDQIYAYNFNNYISPLEMENGEYMLFADYYGQYIEVEARAFANLFTNTEVFK